MELVRPSAEYKASYLEAIREMQAEGQKTEFNFELAETDFDRFVQELHGRAEGKYMKPGYVPETVFWLVEGNQYLGRLSIRHVLNNHLLQIGGHIGYDIRPSERQKGYGTAILRLGLTEAEKLGISRALLTCDETNTASRKIIEANGGQLENQVPNPEGGPDKLRYWINV